MVAEADHVGSGLVKCIGRRTHTWDRGVYNARDEARRTCTRCWITGREWQMAREHRRYAWDCWDLDCQICVETERRDQAYEEQSRVRTRLHDDEADVLALYRRVRPSVSAFMFQFRTPDRAREEFPEWQLERTRRTEIQRQRRSLRQGHATMKAIRRVLRGQDPLPLPE